MRIGYTLMSEQSGPKELVRYAARAEQAGFDFEVMSDHYFPWLDSMGHAPNAWAVLGVVAHVTERVELMTYVTCPIMRYHPAVVAQQAATVGLLSDGRFTLGLGAGESLNEHVVGRGWPPVNVRHEMFGEALDIIRQLFGGEYVNYAGQHFRVDSAKLWDVPPNPPQIGVAVSGAEETQKILGLLSRHGMKAADLSDNELAKLHVRHLVGGRTSAVGDEMLYRFEFPERPGALMAFLNGMGSDWNITLFHYRNHGADYGRVLVGMHVPPADRPRFTERLHALGYPFEDETENPTYRMFLGG